MASRLLSGLVVGVLISGAVFAADTEVILGDKAGATALSIKDSSSVEVLRINSSGEVKGNGPAVVAGGTSYYPQFRWDPVTASLRATLYPNAVDTATPGLGSFAQGVSAVASGTSSIALGNGNTASADSAIAIGKSSTASAGNAVAIGKSLSATAGGSIVLGSGNSTSDQLTNNTTTSLMVGLNSNVPTLYVGPASGGSTFGNVGVGTWEVSGTNLSGRLSVDNGGANVYCLRLNNTDLTDSPDTIRAVSATAGGSTTARLTFTGVWTDASDRRIKTNIKDIKYGLADLMKLRPVSYNLKSNGQPGIGFIAQDVKKVIPEVVHGKDGEMSLSYGQLTALLTKAVQEQQKQINELKGEIAKLKAGK